ncbi:WYL domain-containing protein [Arachidicoccus rhizosphaerae]|uniref:WYL domain-containing protein n=1 Tax=Arachidicoccus rhizosphaerae TaxID=551991 RepID=A0A1H4AJP1_9BACT|nr:WYL domain-containing protein [Arachidicoccus rhizosphaerae]SEA36183.1 WYL domain-containing protein [Arachidicoccus rhizosphaerae]
MSLWDLTEAIKKHLVVKFEYFKFYNREEVVTYEIGPYHLEEFEHRWYLIGWDRKFKVIKTFGMGRVLSLLVLSKHFYPKEINLHDKFKDCYGIVDDPEILFEEIELLFEEVQGEDIKSLHLHATQCILYKEPSVIAIGLTNKITYDFIM